MSARPARSGLNPALVVAIVVVAIALVGLGVFLVTRARPDLISRTGAVAPSSPAAAGWYKLYFTQPRYPDRPEYHQGGIDERLVRLIDEAQSTVDLAIYDFDLENVADALDRATKRGVPVRFVTDSDTLTSSNQEIQAAVAKVKGAGIPIIDDNRGAIMHHKFAVIDGQTVLTGSWNFTVGDTYRLNNNTIVIRSPELAANYLAEFEKMFVRKIFGPTKPAGVPNPVLTIEGTRLENYFAPEDKVAPKIVTRLSGARSSVRFLAFSFTHDDLGEQLIKLHQAGVKVEGVFETTGSETRFSEFGRLKQAGLPVWQDGNPYVMHHKVFIIDDQTVIFGSYNFSSNADTDNDENLLIVDNPEIARAFTGEYEKILAQAQNPPERKR